MTEKQEKILFAALELFASQGYDATSTNKVAKAAGVSEGLIFRHYTNKEGLLQAIMELGKEKTNEIFACFSEINEPQEIIRHFIELPFTIENEQLSFWKLLYALKWQTEEYNTSLVEPMRTLLIDTFKKLKYKNPENEADVILLLIDGAATTVILKKPQNIEGIKNAILEKYNL